MVVSSVVLASGLVLLGLSHGALALYGAWLVLGLGMAMGLYDAAFAALVWIHGPEARRPITGITLIAGFASTVGWPLTAFLAERYGWRICCFAWAGINLGIALPLYIWCLSAPRYEGARGAAKGEAAPVREAGEARRTFVLLAVWFAATAFVTSALAAHLPRLLLAAGATAAVALLASTLLGPAQVAARLAEFFAMQRWRFHPLTTARVATGLLPAGGLVLGVFGGPAFAACAFALVHGAGNGMITIAKGTLPLALFGTVGYGYRQGLLAILARAMQAAAPFAFAVTMEAFGARGALALYAGMALVALGALLGLRTGSPLSRG
jgi:hypothetical protein